MLDKIKIACAWKRADCLALKIWEAFCARKKNEEAEKAQKELREWLDYVRENGLVYNGCLDEYIKIKLWEN